MIKFFRNWCEGIIVAVVISIIIETILPEGKNKKYVNIIVGIYLIFTILSPFLSKFNNRELNNIDLPTIQTSNDIKNTANIRQLYLDGIKESIKSNINNKFAYKINDLEISYDENYENINKIIIRIKKSNTNEIEKIQIGNNIEKKENYSELIEYLNENYNIDKQNIIIK